MSIQNARKMLDQFRARIASGTPEQRLILRVATKWVVADMLAEYDLIMRLQILEGAGGVPVSTWSNHGRQGLREAIGHFSVRKDSKKMDPAWLAPRTSGISNVSYGIAQAEIRRWSVGYALPMEPFDVLNGMIMGLGNKAEVWKSGKPLYRLGQHDSVKKDVLGGSTTPMEVARIGIGVFIKNRVEAFAKSTRKERVSLPVDAEGNVRDIQDRPKNESPSPDELLIGIIFRDRTDPLGVKVRKLMRNSWKDTPQAKAMDLWLDAFETSGRFPRKLDVAQAAGYAQAVSFSKAWKTAWSRFFTELWKNTNLIQQLQDRFEEEGVAWIPKPPADFDEVLQRAKQASLLRRVASRFLFS